MRRALVIGGGSLALVALLALAAPARAAKLRLEGWPGSAAQGELLAAPALRADSTALPRVLGTLVARLESQGWLDARAHARHELDAGEPVLVIAIEPGRRYRWGTLEIESEHADSVAYAAALGWHEGGTADPGALGTLIARGVDAAEAAGYAWASLGVSGWSEDSDRVSVRLTGARGPRVTVDELRIDGLAVTRPEVVEKAMGHLRGNAYNPAAVRLATQRLTQLGIFRRVDYVGLASTGDWRHGALHWRVEEPRYNSFEGAVGVQGAGSVVGLAKLDLGNLLGTARSVSLSWQSRGRGLTDFGARYVEPMLFGRALRWEGALQQQIQDSTYTRFRWATQLGAAVGDREKIEAGFADERVVQTRIDVQDADVQNTTFAITRDGRDDERDPRTGSRLRLEATQSFTRVNTRPSATTAESNHDASGSAAQLDGEWHRRLHGSAGLALELRAAGRFSSQRVLELWERYSVGGAASLRGHDEEEFRVDRYVLTRLEWRWFLGAPGQRVALFWDHAQMQTRNALAGGGDALANQSGDGLGVGLRLPAAGGDVDIDYGLAPGHGFLEGKIHLRLVTAF